MGHVKQPVNTVHIKTLQYPYILLKYRTVLDSIPDQRIWKNLLKRGREEHVMDEPCREVTYI